jgi:hypothetical protein
VSWHPSAANWLHKAAYHVALRAKAAAARRRVLEARPCGRASDDPLEELTDRELVGVLDEELTGLPERYRAPLVLCYLEGTTRDEAGRQLGCPLGTLKSRLERGRELLARRLARRGISLAAALAAAEMGEGVAPAAVTPALINATMRAALAFAAGTAGAAPLTPRVIALADGALPSSAFGWWKVALPLVFLLASLSAGAGLLIRGHGDTAPEVAADPHEPPAEPERRDRFGDPLPAGAVARFGRPHVPGVLLSALSAENNWAYWTRDGTLWLWHLRDGDWPRVLRRSSLPDAHLFALAFLPGGKSLAVVGGPGDKVYLWDFASGDKAPVDGRTRYRPRADGRGPQAYPFRCFAVSPDGKLLAGGQPRSGRRTPKVVLWEAAAGRELRQLNPVRELAAQEPGVCWLAFSADGKLLVSADEDGTFGLWDVETGNQASRFQGSPLPPGSGSQAIALAPNGRTVAQTLQRAAHAVIGPSDHHGRYRATFQHFRRTAGVQPRYLHGQLVGQRQRRRLGPGKLQRLRLR